MKILPFLLFPFVAVAAPEIITLDKATNGVLPFVAVSNMIPARSNHLVTSWHLNQTTGTLFSVVTGSSALAFLHTTNYIKGETNTLNLKIDGLSNSVVVITNDLQGQILSQSNRITGVSNYVVSITDDYVRTNHTLAINGIVGNFDSNLSYTIPVGALVGTTNYIDAGNLANSNHAIQATNDLFQTITNSLDVRLMQVTNLTVRSGATIVGNSLITNGSLRVYSSAGSGTPDFQIGRYDNLIGFGFNAKNESTQPIANNPWFRITGGANDGLVLNPGNDGAFILFGQDKYATVAIKNKLGINTLTPTAGYDFDVNGSGYIRTNLIVIGKLNVNTNSTSGKFVVRGDTDAAASDSDNIIAAYANNGTLGMAIRYNGLYALGSSANAPVLLFPKGSGKTVLSSNNLVYVGDTGTRMYIKGLRMGGADTDNTIYNENRPINITANNAAISLGSQISAKHLLVNTSGDVICSGTITSKNLVVTNMIYGDRTLLTFGKTSGGITNFYAGYAAVSTSTNASLIAIRNGSVIGMSTRLYVNGVTTPGDIWCEVWIEDTVALSNKVAISGTGWYSCIATTNRNVYPFVAGDVLTVYHRYVGFAGSVGQCYDSIEIVNDN